MKQTMCWLFHRWGPWGIPVVVRMIERVYGLKHTHSCYYQVQERTCQRCLMTERHTIGQLNPKEDR